MNNITKFNPQNIQLYDFKSFSKFTSYGGKYGSYIIIYAYIIPRKSWIIINLKELIL